MCPPPGFGESEGQDSKQCIFVLELVSFKTARPLPLPDVAGKRPVEFREVQVRCGDAAPANCVAKLESQTSKATVLEGKVDYAVYPSDYLPLVMNVKSRRRGTIGK